jgi:hypothetical protein
MNDWSSTALNSGVPVNKEGCFKALRLRESLRLRVKPFAPLRETLCALALLCALAWNPLRFRAKPFAPWRETLRAFA